MKSPLWCEMVPNGITNTKRKEYSIVDNSLLNQGTVLLQTKAAYQLTATGRARERETAIYRVGGEGGT